MNTTEYKEYCENFFQQGSFQSVEILEKEITNLGSEEFQQWQTNMIKKYDEKQNVIREIVKNMRMAEKFDIKSEDVDWEKDPIDKENNKKIISQYRTIYNNAFADAMEKFEIYNQKQQQLIEQRKKEAYENSLKIEVDEKEYIAEQIIDVLWCGWECDSSAWLVNDEGVKKIVMTNHGSASFVDKSHLEDKIAEYEKAIADTKDMLSRL